jgi:hypothetical protein
MMSLALSSLMQLTSGMDLAARLGMAHQDSPSQKHFDAKTPGTAADTMRRRLFP